MFVRRSGIGFGVLLMLLMSVPLPADQIDNQIDGAKIEFEQAMQKARKMIVDGLKANLSRVKKEQRDAAEKAIEQFEKTGKMHPALQKLAPDAFKEANQMIVKAAHQMVKTYDQAISQCQKNSDTGRAKELVMVRSRIAKTFGIKTAVEPVVGPLETMGEGADMVVDLKQAGGLSDRPSPVAGEVKYLEIPLTGGFGTELLADGVIDALDYAARSGVEHIVFVLDSPGGAIGHADKIQKRMKELDEKLTYHCLIKRAISASIWVVYASDTIHIVDGGTVGGAVVYSRIQTGNAEVDAKMNSIIAADMVATAQSKNHPELLVKPMILQEAEVYAWPESEGKVALAAAKPKGVDHFIVRDTRGSVLTMTHDQAVGVGLARHHDGGAETLGRALGILNWKSHSGYGEAAMRRALAERDRAKEQAEQMMERFQKSMASFQAQAQALQSFDPRKGSYMTDPKTGEFTPNSRRDWIRNCDRAAREYRKVISELKRLERYQSELREMGMPADRIPTAAIEKIKVQLETAVKQFRAMRTLKAPPRS